MLETFRDIIDSFEDRQGLAGAWNVGVPAPFRVTAAAITLWRHRDSIPGWAWSGLLSAAKELGRRDITVELLGRAKVARSAQRAA